MRSIPVEHIQFFKRNSQVIDKLIQYEGELLKNVPEYVVMMAQEFRKTSPDFDLDDYRFWKLHRDIYDSPLYEVMSEQEE